MWRLVHDFYGRARADPRRGPIFEAHVDDWDVHLAKMVDFWSSALRGTARDRGMPMPTAGAMTIASKMRQGASSREESHMCAVRRIVVGTDFSAASRAAVERAVRLAATHGAALALVHAIDADATHAQRSRDSADPVADASRDERIRQRLATLAASLADRARIDIAVHVESGAPARVIDAYARASGSSLLVVGSRADATISGLGSTAAKVVRSPICPVLTVRAAGPGAYESIVVATDMREGAARAAAFALELFPSAHHRLLHALAPASGDDASMREDSDELRARQQRRYEAAKASVQNLARQLSETSAHPVKADVAEDVPARAVLVYAADLPADCVVIGHHAGEPDPELVLGSLAQHVIYSSLCDVLVVP